MTLIKFFAGLLQDWAWRRGLRARPKISLRKRRVPVEHRTDDAAYYEHARTARLIAADLERTAHREVVRAKLNGGHGAIVWDTAEYPIVLVSLHKRPGESERHSQRHREQQAEREQSTVVDLLGEWDPAKADWSMPALLFEATALERVGALGRLASADDRSALAGSIAEYVLLGADS